MNEFSFLDQKFQIDLLELGRAAETGQKRAVRNQAHRLLDACVGCHEKFRK
jgi:cytochrome c556